jgi:DNA-3-methyladenine glycosylase
MPLSPLPATFYERDGRENAVLEVAHDLLGARLVRRLAASDGQPARCLTGYIVETEAYQGESDLACHARAGFTRRTAVMYGRPGRAYVYFIYGMHWMLNCVTGPEGRPEAVLIRAVLPAEGIEEMARRRGIAPGQDVRLAGRRASRFAALTNGPARVCQALGIDGSCNGSDLCDPHGEVVIEAGARLEITPDMIQTGPRVGIERVPEPWRSKNWRFWLPGWTGPAGSE